MSASRGTRLLCAVAMSAGMLLATGAVAAAAPNNDNSAKLRNAVTLEAVRAHQAAWQAIATMSGGNRFAGLPGHDLSAQYVMDELRDAGYEPTVHTFTYNAFFEQTPSELDQVSPTATTYVNGNDFRVLTYSGPGEVTAPLARPPGDVRGCFAADFAGFTAGSIALVQRGTPEGFPGGA
ncbi:MAG TPA: hypothetical protein VGV67_11165, partial [Solirubrobacteraceae bacterium]|nr:hypothetical protein [Solirubrobacteraceae bacterium]